MPAAPGKMSYLLGLLGLHFFLRLDVLILEDRFCPRKSSLHRQHRDHDIIAMPNGIVQRRVPVAIETVHIHCQVWVAEQVVGYLTGAKFWTSD